MSSRRIALAAVEAGWAVDDDAPLLLDALRRAGAAAEPAMWDDPSVDWSAYDLVVIRSTWDYTERPEEFAAWVDRVAAVTRLANPARAVHWNMDKRYLAALADEGVRTVPTTFLEPGAGSDQVLEACSSSVEVVVKPTVSAGSRDTARHRAAAGTAAAHASALLEAGRPVMVQPYLAHVDDAGETGMVFFDGAFSHAFRKGPLLRASAAEVDGLFAVEEIGPRAPEPDELRLADGVLAAVGRVLGAGTLPYARVDALRDDDGRPVLLELELVEPSFFLATDPSSADRAAATFIALALAGDALERPTRRP